MNRFFLGQSIYLVLFVKLCRFLPPGKVKNTKEDWDRSASFGISKGEFRASDELSWMESMGANFQKDARTPLTFVLKMRIIGV